MKTNDESEVSKPSFYEERGANLIKNRSETAGFYWGEPAGIWEQGQGWKRSGKAGCQGKIIYLPRGVEAGVQGEEGRVLKEGLAMEDMQHSTGGTERGDKILRWD